jgi:hypothetical protein
MRKILSSAAAAAVTALALTGQSNAASPSATHQAEMAASKRPALSDRLHVTKRLTDDGDTKITVIRDADGNVLVRAATDPDTVITLNNLDPDESDGKDFGDDDAGVGVSLSSTVTSQAQAIQKASELSPETIAERRSAIGLASSGPQQYKGRIFASDCIVVTDEVYWKGCYERRHVPDDDANHWYTLDTSWAAGHHDGRLGYMDWAYTANRYFKSSEPVEIVRQRPTSEITASDECTQRTMSLAFEGVGVLDEFSLCPEKIRVGGDLDSVYAIWDGHSSDDSKWVATEAMSVPRMDNDSNSVLTHTIKVDEDEVG